MKPSITLAIIGLDSSHTIDFARLLQGDAPQKVRGMRIAACMRFPSPFQTEPQQDGRQRILEGWGIRVTRSFADAVDGVDGVLLAINDPAQHWTYFRKAAGLGLPVFVDKPLAKNLADGRKILALARRKHVPAWESSTLRFAEGLIAARRQMETVELCNIHGALGKAAAGSSLVWYGCHTFQMLHAVMGAGARTVQAIAGTRGVVSVVEYDNGRRGVVECITGCYQYGGRLQSGESVVSFVAKPNTRALVLALRAFFAGGDAPTPLAASLEVQAILEAAERSLKTGQPQKVLE